LLITLKKALAAKELKYEKKFDNPSVCNVFDWKTQEAFSPRYRV
jgi:hypothetical protein